jgi:hypothetical protein
MALAAMVDASRVCLPNHTIRIVINLRVQAISHNWTGNLSLFDLEQHPKATWNTTGNHRWLEMIYKRRHDAIH